MIPPRAVLLDAMGTLVHFGDPAPELKAGLRRTLGVEVGLDAARRAMAEEIAFYRARLHRAADAASLERLRGECADVVARSLGLRGVPTGLVLGVLLDAIRFEPYPEVPAALGVLRERGIRLVACSNWDVSLHEVLARIGLAPRLDGAVSSAEAGAAKPEGEIFTRALALAGVEAGAAWHVGDSPAEDVEGARGAGIEPVLVVRDGGPAPAGVRTIASLAELPALLGR